MKTARPVKLLPMLKNAMVDHAIQALPNECCGVLLGQKETISRVVPMKSNPPSPDSYFMDLEQQIAVFSEMDKRRETLMGIYHSHPDGPAHPSGMDLQLAFHPRALYFIISLEDKDNPEIGAFTLEEGKFRETLQNICDLVSGSRFRVQGSKFIVS